MRKRRKGVREMSANNHPKKIAVLTSGGDSPGMNAAIRAVVRYAYDSGLEVIGVKRGYKGLIEGDFVPLTPRSVSGIIDKGGTILLSAREPRFFKKEYRRIAFENLKEYEVDGLVVIGGDGSFTGAKVLAEETGIQVVGIPGTIDNDLGGTDYTLGYDTALNNAMQAIDKIRDTANALERVFVVEVMGRNCGVLALEIALSTGSELVLIPEHPLPLEEVAKRVVEYKEMGKYHVIIVLAEGYGHAHQVVDKLKKLLPDKFELKYSVLGHIQRGGSPTAKDRMMASLFAQAAVDGIIAGKTKVFTAAKGEEISLIPIERALQKENKIKDKFLKLLESLAI